MQFPLMLAEAATSINPYIAVLLDNLVEAAVFLLVPVVGLALRKLFVYAETKLGFDLDDALEQKIQALAQDAVLRAGEWARARTKLGEQAPTGAQKLANAVDFVQSQLIRLGYDELAREKVIELVEAALARKKAEAVHSKVALLASGAENSELAKTLDVT